MWGGYLNSASVKAARGVHRVVLRVGRRDPDSRRARSTPAPTGTTCRAVRNLVTVNVGPGPIQQLQHRVRRELQRLEGRRLQRRCSTMAKAASGHWKTFTFRLWENGDSNDVDWKRFGKNPSLQVSFEQQPSSRPAWRSRPAGRAPTAHRAPRGSGSSTRPASPRCRPRSSPRSATRWRAIFRYQKGHGTGYDLDDGHDPGSATASGTVSQATIPASFTNALADGTEVSWEVRGHQRRTEGNPVSPWSPLCSLLRRPGRPARPDGDARTSPAPRRQLDGVVHDHLQRPRLGPGHRIRVGPGQDPVHRQPAAAQIITLNGAEPRRRSKTSTFPGPGPHTLFAYAATRRGTTRPGRAPTTRQPSPRRPTRNATYSSFSAALTAKASFHNAMISQGAACRHRERRRERRRLLEAELEERRMGARRHRDGRRRAVHPPQLRHREAGQRPGREPDDRPARRQPGQLAGVPGDLDQRRRVLPGRRHDRHGPGERSNGGTAPRRGRPRHRREGRGSPGTECDSAGTEPATARCRPARSTTGPGPTADLRPDGPELGRRPGRPGRDGDRRTGCAVRRPGRPASKIYAFAVPLDPAEPVASVTLPDIGEVRSEAGGTSCPALHIFGIAVANTTTATPAATALAGRASPGPGRGRPRARAPTQPPRRRDVLQPDVPHRDPGLGWRIVASGSGCRTTWAGSPSPAGSPSTSGTSPSPGAGHRRGCDGHPGAGDLRRTGSGGDTQ